MVELNHELNELNRGATTSRRIDSMIGTLALYARRPPELEGNASKKPYPHRNKDDSSDEYRPLSRLLYQHL